jgi:hypothetical protein
MPARHPTLLAIALASCARSEPAPAGDVRDDATIDRDFVRARTEIAKELAEGWQVVGSRFFANDACSDVPIRAHVNGIIYGGATTLSAATTKDLPQARALAECGDETRAALSAIGRTSAPWTVVSAQDEVTTEGKMGKRSATGRFGEGGNALALLAALRRFDASTPGCRKAAEGAGLGELDWGPTVVVADQCTVLPEPK